MKRVEFRIPFCAVQSYQVVPHPPQYTTVLLKTLPLQCKSSSFYEEMLLSLLFLTSFNWHHP